MVQPESENDVEKAISAVKSSKGWICRPTITAVDIFFDGRTQRLVRHARALRTNEAEYLASLPPLVPHSARIYLREEDCSAIDAFALQGTRVLELCKQESQLLLRLFPSKTSVGPESFECAVARLLEASDATKWNKICKDDKFDSWDLCNLFSDSEEESQGFLVQWNQESSQLHEHAKPETFDETDLRGRKLFAGRFGGDTLFWEKYSTLKFHPSKVDGAFEVDCTFPAFSYAGSMKLESDEYVCPLLIQFEKLLLSNESSVSLRTALPSLVKTYIVLDYLKCTTVSWVTFLKRLSHTSRPKSMTQSQHDNDTRVTTALRNAASDLQSCVSYVIERALLLEEFESTQSQDANMQNKPPCRKEFLIRQDLKAQTDYLIRRSSNLVERSQRLLEADNAATSNHQAQSAGRLTVVASIFLPLTLAASLLAMNVPAASIGRLWYDFAGMVICIGFICFAAYTAYGKMQGARQNIDSPIGAMHLFSPGIDSKEPISDAILSLLLWGIPAVVVASFLAGMFNSFDYALDALKFGLPILAAMFIVALAFGFPRYFLPLRDVYNTVQFVDALIDSKEGDDSESMKPKLSEKPYNKTLKDALAAVIEACPDIKLARPSASDNLMVDLVHQFCREAKKVLDLDNLLEKPIISSNNSK